VDDQTERFTRCKPASHAAAWCFFFFFRNIWLSEPNVPEKETIFSALPEANRNVHPDEHLIWNRPRTSCHMTKLMRSLTRKSVGPPAGWKIP